MNCPTALAKSAACLGTALIASLSVILAVASDVQTLPDFPSDVFAPARVLQASVKELDRASPMAAPKQAWTPLEPDAEDPWLKWIVAQDGTNLPKHPPVKRSLVAEKGN